MDDKKNEFDTDVDLDSLISYFSKDEKSNAENKMSINKEAIKKTSQEKKKFVVHIDESELNYSESNNNKPSDNSSVYFSNYPKRKTNTQNKAPTAAKPSSQSVKKKVKSVGGNFAVILFACIILFTTLTSYVSISGLNDILAINTSDVVIKVEIPEDPTYDDILDILHDNDLIKQKMLCNMFAKFRHYDDEDNKYLSGVYYLNRSMGIEGMLNKCMAAPESAETVTLGFPEGWTIKQIFEKLEKYDVCKTDRLYSALTDVDYEFDFVRSLTAEEERYQLLEGYIFPDTYNFYLDADANYVIRKFLSNFNDRWTDEYQARADKLGYTMDEIIIIASIIQKEAADSSQMKAVSSVIHNRLKNSVKFPTLGCDSTAIYVSNYVKPVVGGTKGNYYLSKYDTAANKGLPPGPICNPGVDAIEAALYPSDTSYYYFLHDNSGKIYMARTQQEHESNYVLAIKANNAD
ncbi:MAG: endolytic transglycosylase MltG [Clostridia bacterium]|nr:endolytic transglycosylase MltG [Clostridia bacterium]